MRFLLKHNAEVRRLATDKVQFNASLPELKTLRLASRSEPAYQLSIEEFNQHLQMVKSDIVVAN